MFRSLKSPILAAVLSIVLSFCIACPAVVHADILSEEEPVYEESQNDALSDESESNSSEPGAASALPSENQNDPEERSDPADTAGDPGEEQEEIVQSAEEALTETVSENIPEESAPGQEDAPEEDPLFTEDPPEDPVPQNTPAETDTPSAEETSEDPDSPSAENEEETSDSPSAEEKAEESAPDPEEALTDDPLTSADPQEDPVPAVQEDPQTDEVKEAKADDGNLPLCELYSVTLGKTSMVYAAKTICPSITVTAMADGIQKTLTEGKDYIVSLKECKHVGTGTITVTGTGRYTGTITKFLTITPCPIRNSDISICSGESSFIYTGKSVKPAVAVTSGTTAKMLKEGIDYTVSYSDNLDAGKAVIVVRAKGNYKGTAQKSFRIKPVKITDVSNCPTVVRYSGIAKTYNNLIVVKAVVNHKAKTLTWRKDYTISYENNTNAGTAAITIAGKGNFTGTVRKTFRINPVRLDSAKLDYTTKTFAGGAFKPGAAVTAKVNNKTVVLKRGRDFSITYKNNKNVGSATATITGKGNFTGKLTRTFKITPREISRARSSLFYTKTGYTGAQRRPAVTVIDTLHDKKTDLKKDRDYTVSYSNNICRGTAVVTISGMGNYKGSVTRTFKIQSWDYLTWAMAIARDDSHGYRYDASYGKEEVEYDCASLIYWALKHFGYPVPDHTWYTKDMYREFKALPHWTILPYNRSGLLVGDIVWKNGHAEIYSGNNTWTAARGVWIGNNAGTGNGSTRDESGLEIAVYNYYAYPDGTQFEWIARWQ